jgi:hypothetical protein
VKPEVAARRGLRRYAIRMIREGIKLRDRMDKQIKRSRKR